MRDIFKTNSDVARDCIEDSKLMIENIEKYRSEINNSMAVPAPLLSDSKPMIGNIENSKTHRDYSQLRYALGMYGWEIKELPEGLHIGIRGCPVVISYDYIDEAGYESVLRYCKARFTLSKAHLK